VDIRPLFCNLGWTRAPGFAIYPTVSTLSSSSLPISSHPRFPPGSRGRHGRKRKSASPPALTPRLWPAPPSTRPYSLAQALSDECSLKLSVVNGCLSWYVMLAYISTYDFSRKRRYPSCLSSLSVRGSFPRFRLKLALSSPESPSNHSLNAQLGRQVLPDRQAGHSACFLGPCSAESWVRLRVAAEAGASST
jgi:hypothetical protein